MERNHPFKSRPGVERPEEAARRLGKKTETARLKESLMLTKIRISEPAWYADKYERTEYAYDSRNNLVSAAVSSQDTKPGEPPGDNWKLHLEFTYTYNERNNLIREEHRCRYPEEGYTRTDYQWDEQGRLLRTEERDETETLWKWEDFTYSPEGRCQEKRMVFLPKMYYDHRAEDVSTYTYDGEGRLVLEEVSHTYGTNTEQLRYEYIYLDGYLIQQNIDIHGIKSTVYYGYEAGRLTKEGDLTYTYNQHGDLTELRSSRANSPECNRKYRHFYDAQGNLARSVWEDGKETLMTKWYEAPEEITVCYHCFQEKKKDEGRCPHCGYVAAMDWGSRGGSLPTGTTLKNRYVIGRAMDIGKYTYTYLAMDYLKEKRVWIQEFFPKELAWRGHDLKLHIADGQENLFMAGLEALEAERNVLLACQDLPGIPKYLDCFQDRDTGFLVTEYREGITLDQEEVFRKGQALGWKEAWELLSFRDILASLHKNGISHMQLTPEKIQKGADGRWQLLELGAQWEEKAPKLAQYIDQHDDGPIRTNCYQAPECFNRKGEQGPWTDVYAYGAMLVQAVTGRKPFSFLQRISDNLPPWSCSPEPVLGRARTAVLEKALSIDPRSRYQTMGEFLLAMEQAEQESTIRLTTGGEPEITGQAPEPAREKRKIKWFWQT